VSQRFANHGSGNGRASPLSPEIRVSEDARLPCLIALGAVPRHCGDLLALEAGMPPTFSFLEPGDLPIPTTGSAKRMDRAFILWLELPNARNRRQTVELFPGEVPVEGGPHRTLEIRSERLR
jgi:hypothetical protein